MRLLILAFAAILFFACDESDSKASQDANAIQTDTASTTDAISDSANYTAIEWLDSTTQNIGKVKKGQVVEITWRFKNAGYKPLIIQDVSPGCGCTVADKPEAPVAPGEEGVIKGKFDSNNQSEGEHNKMISVLANTVNTNNHQLIFRVEVIK